MTQEFNNEEFYAGFDPTLPRLIAAYADSDHVIGHNYWIFKQDDYQTEQVYNISLKEDPLSIDDGTAGVWGIHGTMQILNLAPAQKARDSGEPDSVNLAPLGAVPIGPIQFPDHDAFGAVPGPQPPLGVPPSPGTRSQHHRQRAGTHSSQASEGLFTPPRVPTPFGDLPPLDESLHQGLLGPDSRGRK